MSVLTTVQVKRVAQFLKASSAKIPQFQDQPKLGQWLDIIARASGFRDWNAMSATIPLNPSFTDAEINWLNSHWTFYGIARVMVEGKASTNHITHFSNHEVNRHEAAKDLARKILNRSSSEFSNQVFNYTQPDVILPNGNIDTSWANKTQGCPIIITSKDKKTVIFLWWLSYRYTPQDNIPEWASDFETQGVEFENHCDIPPGGYGVDDISHPLTDVFLSCLTGKKQPRRTCIFTRQWSTSSVKAGSVLLEEGCPNAHPIGEDLRYEIEKFSVSSFNAGRGLSTIDCEAIAQRYKDAEVMRNEDDHTELSGIYEELQQKI